MDGSMLDSMFAQAYVGVRVRCESYQYTYLQFFVRCVKRGYAASQNAMNI